MTQLVKWTRRLKSRKDWATPWAHVRRYIEAPVATQASGTSCVARCQEPRIVMTKLTPNAVLGIAARMLKAMETNSSQSGPGA
jgi:hypothetical protein